MDNLPGPAPILCVVGARPNLVKMAPLLKAFATEPGLPPAVLVHTGQHYDHALNGQLFADLDLPVPDINLEVGSGTHAVQTAEVMKRFEPVLDRYRPCCIIVVGDVNSTLACSLVAAKKSIAVVHIEAGLRSFDRTMPEEINRLLTDQIADLLYTTERSAHDNLAREGIPADRIEFVGNLMIDSLLAALPKAIPVEQTLRSAGNLSSTLQAGGYGVVTLHRPSNVDLPGDLGDALRVLGRVAERLPLVWPLHPRTRANIEQFGLSSMLTTGRTTFLPPQGYLEMVGLLSGAAIVITDSGGVQEETTALGVPCLTMRDSTERPITVEQGTNTLVPRDEAIVIAAVQDILDNGGKRGRIPALWDGHAAPRIASHLNTWLQHRVQASASRCKLRPGSAGSTFRATQQ